MNAAVARRLGRTEHGSVIDVYNPALLLAWVQPTLTLLLAVTPQVAHLKRGVYGWNMEGLPFEGEYDPAGAGRTPSVVEEEIFAYGRKVGQRGSPSLAS